KKEEPKEIGILSLHFLSLHFCPRNSSANATKSRTPSCWAADRKKEKKRQSGNNRKELNDPRSNSLVLLGGQGDSVKSIALLIIFE
ncbi:MAG TPA: hypothetical protein VLN73_02450, partial [Alphaproteobacteria bacterium]|nr:hypothetical protein [Alphaproteobacteria bacterium]